MIKNIVLSGTDVLLHNYLVDHLVAKEWRVADCYDANASDVSLDELSSVKRISWTPYSAFSTGASVLAAKKFLGHIDEAVVHIANDHVAVPFYRMNWTQIERTIDRSLKGVFFLVREIALQLMKQEGGNLLLVYRQTMEEENPLHAMIDHAISRMGETLYEQFSYTDTVFRAIRSDDTEVQKFSEHVMTLLDEEPARAMKRWSRYSERSGMFSFRS